MFITVNHSKRRLFPDLYHISCVYHFIIILRFQIVLIFHLSGHYNLLFSIYKYLYALRVFNIRLILQQITIPLIDLHRSLYRFWDGSASDDGCQSSSARGNWPPPQLVLQVFLWEPNCLSFDLKFYHCVL